MEKAGGFSFHFEKPLISLDNVVGKEERPHHYAQDDFPPCQMGKAYGKQPTTKPKSPSDRCFFHVNLLDSVYKDARTRQPAGSA